MRGLTLKAKKNLYGYTFILPALLCFAVFVLIPLVFSVVLSFYKTDMFFMNMEFVGFKNFGRIFKDSLYWRAIVNILLYTVMAVPLNILISLLLAVLVKYKVTPNTLKGLLGGKNDT